ncbi:MAG: signal recognition particle-docking protein FtsY [Holosporaceae bacterium]|jgi:fused signal recognition particle receptor|nr:signal recognition particle-docking protein FtsY [Holosporaceae bacterium]
MSFLSKIKSALQKTSREISSSIAGKKIDENFVQQMEDALILADVGVETATELTEKISARRFTPETQAEEIKQLLIKEITAMLAPYESNFFAGKIDHNPYVILVIGVNGNGKTTTVAKIANIFKNLGHRPLLVAADTFRAAAVEQLAYWAHKIQADIFTGKEKADPAGLAYNSLDKARQNNNDLVLIDTAGRMQNRDDLLAELEKIKRSVKKNDATAPHSIILILDGLTGQSVHNQVDIFLEKIGVDGIIITKLDGTAKGGALIALTRKYKIPILAVGVGENIDDLKPFNAGEYASAILDA